MLSSPALSEVWMHGLGGPAVDLRWDGSSIDPYYLSSRFRVTVGQMHSTGLLCLSFVFALACTPNGKKPEPQRAEENELAGDKAVPPRAAPALANDATNEAVAQPLPITDVPDSALEYEGLAKTVIVSLQKKKFEAFVTGAMATKTEIRAFQQAIGTSCPQLVPTGDQLERAEAELAEYEPGGEIVKSAFDACSSLHNFANAKFVSAKSRSHKDVCGEQTADHVEVVVALGETTATIVIDDLLKTQSGWRAVDSGIFCESEVP